MAPMISLADTDGSATNLGFESFSIFAALAFSFSAWTTASNLDAAMCDCKTTGHRSNGKMLNTEKAATDTVCIKNLARTCEEHMQIYTYIIYIYIYKTHGIYKTHARRKNSKKLVSHRSPEDTVVFLKLSVTPNSTKKISFQEWSHQDPTLPRLVVEQNPR